ncbi:hypothetical protein Cpar_0892 [Chlorobaculum parvum NCIB 8327]|uniref:Uncharacterized protein n=1 Tax=Chlorobaculum parvum (strain DSM 263 / NCIMB 8327) TaxID=517417 RepID=B3QN02_CHLP8|nr:hypothetical protein [Chlorobaculum parvum]ACF11305.1 hypothetical protein Cpar_0892 [Chlorobaculum parvum NCIB 8327]
MPEKSVTIPKEPKRQPDQNFTLLRHQGIELIERMSSKWWTDYNSHDPGITILEALCYAITDLGYRIGWNVQDLLADPPGKDAAKSTQPFFTARQTLTVNPLTADDFRRLLIDHDGVRNAWATPRKSVCESYWYPDFKEDRLSFLPSVLKKNVSAIWPLGMWDIHLQFETHPELGDLNERKATYTLAVETDPSQSLFVTLEFRLPEWDSEAWGQPSGYVDSDGKLLKSVSKVSLKNAASSAGQKRSYTVDIELFIDNETQPSIVLEQVPVSLYGTSTAIKSFGAAFESNSFFEQELVQALAEPFILKSAAVRQIMEQVSATLQSHRNLCEEFCSIKPIQVEEVAVCADIVVAADADIEQALASVLFTIENHFNPQVPFHSLQELLDEGVAVDEIFEGPMLNHGFIRQDELDEAQLRQGLRTSDIINELVEIDGIIAVRNLRLTRLDSTGKAVSGVADTGTGTDKDKVSAEWTLKISDNHLPVLSIENSAFTFYKNELPFTADFLEVRDTLNLLRGQAEQLKIEQKSVLDLPAPEGTWRNPGDYSPVQYELPAIYGTGPDGVREPATEERRAQVKQLKTYLMVFEQLLANAYSQLANARHLFSLDPGVEQTLFVKDLNHEELIRGVSDILKAELDASTLHSMVESDSTMQERRNLFLDHLLARFGERITDYALHLTGYDGKQKSAAQLIKDKLTLLSALPSLSRNRARGLNSEEEAVLKKRIALLAGMAEESEEKIIIVEHLLLRPRFHGDALLEVCLDGSSATSCGRQDPYSFQLTVIMPGWHAPFDSNIDLRRSIERTIRQEIPAHLLGKICWIDNQEYPSSERNKFVELLTTYLRKKGKTAGNAMPTITSASNGAGLIHDAALPVVTAWLESGEYRLYQGGTVKTALRELLSEKLDPLSAIYGGVSNYDTIAEDVFEYLTDHFIDLVTDDRWHLHDRFTEVWNAWLTVPNEEHQAPERSNDFIEQVRKAMIGKIGPWLDPAETARQAVGQFGELFSKALNQPGAKSESLDDPKKFVGSVFDTATGYEPLNNRSLSDSEKQQLKELFIDFYAPRIEQSLLLRDVVSMLARLRSIYPSATLHDCKEGNDINPVRLDSTMLGG